MRAIVAPLAFALAAAFAAGDAVRAGPIPPHPIPESERWATITHPGNAPFVLPPTAEYPDPIGRVDYEYQISRTELTYGEWFEFVQAYAPYVATNAAASPTFTGTLIQAIEVSPGVFQYSLLPHNVNRGASVGWRFAARYCNWLHNGKRPEREAFENGVYDTSTFGVNPNGSLSDQLTHNVGARYWMATIDEWTKAAHWDPDRYGPGQPGYWQYPHGSDTPPTPGVPGEPGAQTSAGIAWSINPVQPGPVPSVAAYYDTQSPWGLWDLSGGAREWLETAGVQKDFGLVARYTRGSRAGQSVLLTPWDRIDFTGFGDPIASTEGVRLVRPIPSPSAAWIVAASAFTLHSPRRRRIRCADRCPHLSRVSSSPESPMRASP